jgi:3-dehydroquinate synthase
VIRLVQKDTQFSELLQGVDYSSLFVLCDENTATHCYQSDWFPPHSLINVPAGEESKSFQTVERVLSQLKDQGADRHSLLLNLGGGVVTDLGGFVASIYMRGIRFINIPTSLLGMVDAAIGGKTGINFSGIKNMVGVFNQPLYTWLHRPFLKTLPQQELRSGWVESLKHGLLKSEILYNKVVHWRDETPSIELILESASYKQDLVTMDFMESNQRKKLNLGHTFGHAIESETGLPHGYAVLIGMWCEIRLTAPVNRQTERITEYLKESAQLFMEDRLPIFEDKTRILDLIKKDKKNKDGMIQVVCWRDFDYVHPIQVVSEKDILQTLSNYNVLFHG